MSSDEPKHGRRTVLRAAAGATGAAGAAVAPAAAQEQRPDWGGWLDGVDGGYRDARGEDEVTVQVGAEGNGGFLAFSPAGLWVDPGTTITWEWTGQGGAHNVLSETGPADLNSGDPVSEGGTTYEHTFEEGGVNTYFCSPHRSLGMKGAVAVGDDVPVATPTPEPAGGLPGGDRGSFVMLLLLGVGAAGAAAVFGAEAWRAIRGTTPPEELGAPTEAPESEPTVEIGHDGYDPDGTLALVLVYFLILLVLWVFMYFVEFLGNGPTVIG